MDENARENLLQRAREAASRGDFGQAHACFAEADVAQPLQGADLGLFANVAYAAGHPALTIDLWERASAQHARAGDAPAAAGAAIRVAFHLLVDTGLMAPVRGWLGRVERLLEGQPESAVHAWLAVVRGYERMLAGDFASAGQWARRAIDVGSRTDPAAAAIGRISEARSLIFEGDVRRGLALLDEAAVATVSGELDPISTGLVYCELVCGLQALGQLDRAEQWTDAFERWSKDNAIGSIHGRCRVHRAEILRLRGALALAEQEALLACEELEPYLRRELGWPLAELGRIRLCRGDLAGAEEAFRSAHELCWDAQPGLALVRLARGEVAQAAALIRDALERPSDAPSKELPPNTELRRAPLLVAQVEIEIAAGDQSRARAAAEELEGIATRFESKALTAGAADARGRVELAAGEAGAARRHFERAARLWDEVGAPYETARAREGVARALDAEGHEAAATLEREAAEATFARIGAGTQARAPEAAAPAPRLDVFRREGDYWSIEFDGRLVRLPDRKGLRYLARLLEHRDREFHVLELVALENGRGEVDVAALGDGGVILDGRAKEAYRRRLVEIDQDVDEAQAMGDLERERRARTERDFLVRELARAVGLGNRDRRAGSASERARVSVTRALRQALSRIREHHAPLGDHLERTVRTGTYCVYQPDPRAHAFWNQG